MEPLMSLEYSGCETGQKVVLLLSAHKKPRNTYKTGKRELDLFFFIQFHIFKHHD